MLALGLAAAYVFAAQALFDRGHIVDLVYPLLGFFLSYLAILVTRSRFESREKERIKDIFSKFVTKDVMNEILQTPGEIAMGGQERELSVLFSDIAGFTTISEAHKPAEVVALLNEYLTEMTREVFATQGTLDKYIGDAVMAVWGAPLPHKDHAERACRAALGMHASLKKLNERWKTAGRTTIDIRVGIHTGRMVAGVMGSQARYEYTCIGDGVNLASRLEGTNKVYGTPIIISESTREQVKDKILNRELDWIKVKGKTQGIGIFEIVSDENATPQVRALYRSFEAGLALYRKREFEEALERFNQGLKEVPGDGPSKVFVERCRWFTKNPPLEGWDGIFTMKTK
jgi:adenylate cyclase